MSHYNFSMIVFALLISIETLKLSSEYIQKPTPPLHPQTHKCEDF